MCPWQDSHLHWSGFEADVSAGWTTRALKVGAPGRIRTGTEPGLSRPPLLVGLRERKGSPHGRAERGETAALTDFKMKAAICTRTDLFLRQAPLLVGLHGEVSGAPGRNFACNLRVRSAALYILRYGSLNWRKPEGMLPMCLRRTICFRNSPGTVDGACPRRPPGWPSASLSRSARLSGSASRKNGRSGWIRTGT
jgi:hypothetical protein